MRLDPLMKPKSIAVIGASEKPTIGRRAILSLNRIGFKGPVSPVNPNYETVLGHTCYPSPLDLPEAPDLAIFCLGHARIFDSFREAAERGIKAAVIYDGGFAERGAEGEALQERIVGLCRDAGIVLCGPNCMGVLSPAHPSTSYLGELHDPTGLAGNVGIVSQSGGVCITLLLDTRRFGFSHVASSGNEAVVGMADFLDYLVDDPNTKTIGCFLESVREPERFAAALDRARERDKPVVALKVGRAERTRRAVATHTAGLAGDSRSFSEMLAAHHAIETSDLVELTEILAAAQGARHPKGRRIGVVTSSGGIAELMLDAAAAAGLDLPPLDRETRARLDREIGYITGDGNPLDAWGNGTFVENLQYALAALDGSAAHDAIAFCRDSADDQPFDSPELAARYLELFVAAAARSDKPHYLLLTRPGPGSRSQLARLREAGIPVVGGIREGLGAIDKLARWAARMGGK
jgi:acyl-CoA synthetase (NDP forming)